MANTIINSIFNRSNGKFPYDYIDFEGNVLRTAEDIAVTNNLRLKDMEKEEGFAGWNSPFAKERIFQYCVKTDGLTPIKGGIAYKDPETGEIFDLRVSRFSGQILPVHAMFVPQTIIQYFGEHGVGKTLLMTQWICESRMFAGRKQGGKFLLMRDDPVDNPMDYPKEREIKEYFQGLLPDITQITEKGYPYSFLASYTKDDRHKRGLIEFRDIAGEKCKEQGYDSPVYTADYILLLISARDLFDPSADLQLEHLLNVIRQKGMEFNQFSGKILVALTMSDRFREQGVLPELLSYNTLERENGRLKMQTHKDGFCLSTQQTYSDAIAHYLENEFPNIYLSLESMGQAIEYFIVGSIDAMPEEGNRFPRDFVPYRIDEMLTYILAQKGLYPYQNEAQVQEQWKNESVNYQKKLHESMKEVEAEDLYDPEDDLYGDDFYDDEEDDIIGKKQKDFFKKLLERMKIK